MTVRPAGRYFTASDVELVGTQRIQSRHYRLGGNMRSAILAIALGAMLPVPVLAQTVTTTRSEVVTVEAKPTDVLSRNVIGLSIRNAQNEVVGEIQDALLSQGAVVGGYIVSVGGFLGMGERYVVVAPNALNFIYSESDKKWYATMDVTKDAIKSAPAFKYEGRWNK